jgi:uncharacterized protein YdeI (BOF family)
MTMDNDDSPTFDPATALPAATSQGRKLRAAPVIIAVLMLAAGAIIGGGAISLTRPSVMMAPMAPVAINALAQDSIVTVKGKVAEIFGNKFVIDDSTGRALVETGRAGEDGKIVAPDEQITVQGRFDDGFIHATFIVQADGKVEALGPPSPPPPPHGWLGRLVGPHPRPD